MSMMGQAKDRRGTCQNRRLEGTADTTVGSGCDAGAGTGLGDDRRTPEDAQDE